VAARSAATRKVLSVSAHVCRIEEYINSTREAEIISGCVRAEPGVRILSSTFLGPAQLGANARVGPNVVAGRYFAMNRDSFVANATVGSFTSIGARTSLNPFNHPHEWLSSHEFQWHKNAFKWVDEYQEFCRIDYWKTPGANEKITIGNDVWAGHNANVLGGVSVGDGAVLGAGSVVTKDVPPFAVVVGVPARVTRFRFSEQQIDRLMRVRWWDLPLSQMSGLPFDDKEDCLEQLERIRASEAADVPPTFHR